QGDRRPVGVGQMVRRQDDPAGLRDVLLTRPPVPHQQPQPGVQDDPGEQPPAGGVAVGRRLASAFAHEISLLVQVVRCRGRINGMTDKAWSVLIPVKVLAEAKSRLASLAWDAVARLIVITDAQDAAVALTALGALVVPKEPRAGLTPALRHGARY